MLGNGVDGHIPLDAVARKVADRLTPTAAPVGGPRGRGASPIELPWTGAFDLRSCWSKESWRDGSAVGGCIDTIVGELEARRVP